MTVSIDISESVFSLCQINERELYFPRFLQEYLSQYCDFCKRIGCTDEVLNNIQTFQRNIIQCTLEYCSGQHAKAKEFFSMAIEAIPIEKMCCGLRDVPLYRARFPKKHIMLKKNKYLPSQMFHIPFEKRFLVSNQRFSFSGVPCLYLGESPEICCDEIGSWANNLNIAVFSPVKEKQIRVLDLAFFENYNFDNLLVENANLFLQAWPLVACCSFRYADPSGMCFRQDYIVSQLLLEFMIDKKANDAFNGKLNQVNGIRYHSAKHGIFNESPGYSCVNYAFPAQEICEAGDCEYLSSIFRREQVYYLKELRSVKKAVSKDKS